MKVSIGIEQMINVLPAVDVSQDLLPFLFAIFCKNVRGDPRHQVVFEDTFNQLMENIWGKQLVDVGPWKFVCERLSR